MIEENEENIGKYSFRNLSRCTRISGIFIDTLHRYITMMFLLISSNQKEKRSGKTFQK